MIDLSRSQRSWSFCPFNISFSSSSMLWKKKKSVLIFSASANVPNAQRLLSIHKTYITCHQASDERLKWIGLLFTFPVLAKASATRRFSSSVAGGDEVSHAAALEECGGGYRFVFAEEFGEGDHLHQSQTNDSCFSVVSTLQTITEACAHCNNVLKQGEIRKWGLVEWQNYFF